jgi:hypothetical protein
MTLRTGLLVSVPDIMGLERRWRTKWEWSGAPTTRSWEVYTRKSSFLGPLGNNFGMCTFLFCYFIIILLCTLGWFGLRPWKGRSYLTNTLGFCAPRVLIDWQKRSGYLQKKKKRKKERNVFYLVGFARLLFLFLQLFKPMIRVFTIRGSFHGKIIFDECITQKNITKTPYRASYSSTMVFCILMKIQFI